MIKFKLENNEIVVYDTIKNQLIYNDIPFVLENNLKRSLNDDIYMRLFLGSKCNYDCKYCIQHDIKEQNEFNGDLDSLVFNLKKFLNGRKLKSVSFWGGEPFFYFDFMKKFYKVMENDIEIFSFTTNGSYLGKSEIFNWIKEHLDRIENIVVSYDGPGQSLRGPDIFDNINIKKNVLYLIEKNKLAFNGVVTKENYNIKSYIKFLKNKLDIQDKSNLKINLSDILICGEGLNEYLLSDQQLKSNIIDLYDLVFDKSNILNIDNFYALYGYILDVISGLNSTELKSSCLVGSVNHLTCDTNGNILVCHNTDKNNFLMNISELKPGGTIPIPGRLQVIKNWNSICKNCMIKYLCNGGCASVLEKYHDIYCQQNLYRHIFYLMCAVTILTNEKVVEVEIND